MLRIAPRLAAAIVVGALAILPSLGRAVGWTDADGVVHFGDPPRIERVEIYMTSWCPACRKARAWFEDRRVEFTEYDIERDAAAARRKRILDASTTIPVVVIDGAVIRGFAPKQFRSVLDLRKSKAPHAGRPPARDRPGRVRPAR